MKNALFFPVLLVLLILSACQTDRSYSRTELPFATDPSVLRGDWSGTILSVPTEQDPGLSLVNLVATCPDAEEGKCHSYIFEGEVSVGGSDFVPISGQGYSGDNSIYVLRAPPIPTSFEASFQYDGAQWNLSGTYRTTYYTSPEDERPFYESYLQAEGTQRGDVFRLEPVR